MNTELTQEQKRIRIAEACGWKEVIFSDPGERRAWEKSGVLTPEGFLACELPDYFGSLDAIIPAVRERITSNNSEDYDANLKDAMEEPDYVWAATAAAHAEAFGRTLNLW